MNSNIIKPEVQRFLEKYIKDDVSRLALSKSPFLDVSSRELAEQLDGKQRSQKKLPLWSSTTGIIFPAKLSIEQSSSEATARYKSNLLKGDKVIDLTGGFGVDTFYFSQTVKEVIHCEKNTELSQIAQHNSNVLGAENIRFVNHDSLLYLQSTEDTFDTIYVDPSRRIEKQKVFLLKDTQPDVVSHLRLFLSKAPRVIIKTSPLFDIQSGLKELINVSEVHVVSLKNDCKELLWIIDRDVNSEPKISCVALSGIDPQLFDFKLIEERDAASGPFSEPLKYLYEPDVALLKAGCFKSIATRFEILKLQSNTHLYTSGNLIAGFIGRTFKVNAVHDYKTFIRENTIQKANVITRNFPHPPEELKKKHKINDGGEEFLIFTTVYPDKLKVISAIINQ